MTAISFKAPPTLARFLRSSAFVRCVVGPVGSGKSSASVVEIPRRAAEQAPSEDKVRRTRFAVIRNTYRQLKDTTRKTFEQWVPSAAGSWMEQDFTFTIDRPLPDGTRIHCEVLFRALDKPDDVKKLLSLELTGAYVNELRELPKHVFDVLQTRVGRYPSKAQGGASWFGIWADTNPWPTNHWGYKLFTKEKPAGFDLFEQPGGRAPNAENLGNLPPGYYPRLCAGKSTEWVSEYVDSLYPSHDKGSIYGDLVAALEARGGALAFEHSPENLFTNWDLGRADSTSIWFWRFGPKGVDVVDFYENHGVAISHYFNVLEQKQQEFGYRYVKHWLPHDARAKTLVTQQSVMEQFLGKYGAGAVALVPELSLLDGLDAARRLLETPMRIHPRCDVPPLPGLNSGMEALRSYRYAWDEKGQCFTRTPVHDWSSHAADSFRYLAIVASLSEALPGAYASEPKPVLPPGATTIDDIRRSIPRRRPERRIG